MGSLEASTSGVEVMNFIFGGVAQNVTDPLNASRPEVYVHRQLDQNSIVNPLKKYIAHILRTCTYDIHGTRPLHGFSIQRPSWQTLRFNHFWGPRVDLNNAKRWFLEDRLMVEPLQRSKGLLWN